MAIVLTWRDATGIPTVLSEANGYKVLRPTKGLGVAAPQNTIESLIAFDGAALTNRRRDTQSLIVPMFVRDAIRAQAKIETLATLLDNGPGQLEYADGVNTRYLKNVIYDGGLGGDLTDAPVSTWRKVNVMLLALDPWWYGPANSQALAVATPTAFDAAISFDSVLPFDGGAAVGVSIVGDAEAFPVITVTGPVTTLTVGASGLLWSVANPLLASDTLIVDHRPGSRGPRLNGGPVDWSLLSEASRLWTLAKGVTSVISGTTGSTGATSISMAWDPRYLAP
jgi:hypothetical protein